MPKIKSIRRVSSASKLLPFFLKKAEKKQPELHDYLFATNTEPATATYPTSWTNPEILSQTNVYRILDTCKLPPSLEALLSISSAQDVNVQSHEEHHCITIATLNSISLYFYLNQNSDRIIQLSMEGIQNPPMIHIIQGSDNRLGILAAEKNGMIKYWDDYKDRTFLTYQIPLSPKEYITTLQEIPGEQVVIGSSQENIYLAQLKRDEISAFSFYSQRSLMRSLSEFFFATRTLPSLSDIGNYGLPCMGKILRIAFVEGYIYITYTKHIAVWRINENEVKLLTTIHIEQYIQQALSLHIPSHLTKDSIQSNMLDLCLFPDGTFIILVSYSVPGMGDYVQFAIITLKHNRSILKENTPLLILHAASVPYSVIFSTLKRTPSLIISCNQLAFVTFDQTLIAISLDKESVFEERLALKEGNDILCTQLNPMNGSVVSTSAVTRKGIIEFQVDIDVLGEQEGNMYENINERDALVFKSRLEQAIFFGVSEDGPLQFPLRTEQDDITDVVLSITNDILKGSELLPKSLELEFYIESRYVFSNRIIAVLIDNELLHTVPESERFKLLKTTEYYHLSIVLYEAIGKNQSFYLPFSDAIRSIVEKEEGDIFRAFFIDHPFDVNTLVGQLISNFDSLDKNTEETASYLLKIQQVILRLAQRAKKYEEKYLPLYEIKNHFGDLWMASGGNMLLSIFEKTHEYVCSSSGNVSDDSMSSLKNELCKISSFLLNHLFDEVNKSTGDVKKSKAKQLKEIQTNIVRGLCECNRFGVAIKLAEKYRSLPSIAVAVQESQLSEIQKQEQHTNFTKIYGYDYLSLVMNWYIDHDQEEKILAFGQHTPSFVNKFFKSKTTKVSWIHYLLQEDYGNALNNLKEYLAKESNIYKRCDMLSWTRMLFVMGLEEDEDVEMDSDNETADSAIESHVLRDLSVDLEFESVQVEMIETFREHLKSMSVNDTAADFILSRHGSAIFQSEDRQEDIDQMKTSIDLLLNETSVSKLSVIRLLVMLDNSGPDVKNIITALKLIHELRDDSRSQFLQIAWKEIYRRDLRHRYVTLFDTLTETQRQSALMETFTYRVAKSNMDELITPTAFVNDFQEQELIQLENLLKAVIDSD